uniref:putative UPF0481 protein At3g02645 n=1 Tax=Erigeron canadensis TaxID=72917 RepID=UPI001CB99E9A|nr:putative UPF0481 protein At3g02645 [Erigeron canadensis]
MAQTSKFSHKTWLEQISNSMKTNASVNKDNETTLCIFAVPESFVEENPEAYKPQKLGLGPYHHFRDAVYKSEWDKVATVRSMLNEDHVNQFNDLVAKKIRPLYGIVHAFYGNFFDMDADTFSWMFAIDGLFLLSQIYSCNREEFVSDIMMLENQIPFYVLRELRATFHGFMNHVEDDDWFSNQLIKFCHEIISPLDISKEAKDCLGCASSSGKHLLDLLYKLIVYNGSTEQGKFERSSGKSKVARIKEIKESVRAKFPSCLSFRQGLGHVMFLTRTAIDVALHLFTRNEEEQAEQDKINSKEIKIPSVSQLHDVVNVEFKVSQGGIRSVEFDKEHMTFYLPTINVDENTEVILRNLVAYEATMLNSNSILIFAEYVDLMCGIIDKPRDVAILRKREIVRAGNNMDDEEIAKLFNGIKCTTWDRKRKHQLNIALTKVNDRFLNSTKYKVFRFMKKHVYNSWKFLTLMATIVLLILTGFQSFCDVYGCSDHFFPN